MFMDNNKIKKRENVGLPKLEDFSSAPMPRCKPVKRPPSQFKNEYLKYLESDLDNFEMTDNEKLMLKKMFERNGVIERYGGKVDREKIREYANILEQIEDLESMLKAIEGEEKNNNWTIKTGTKSYGWNISRNESRKSFIQWVKTEIKLLEELIK